MSKPELNAFGPVGASDVTVCGITPVHTNRSVSHRLIVIAAGENWKSWTLTVCEICVPKLRSLITILQGCEQSVVVMVTVDVHAGSVPSVITMTCCCPSPLILTAADWL